MPNVAEIIKDHVTLEVNCVDRQWTGCTSTAMCRACSRTAG